MHLPPVDGDQSPLSRPGSRDTGLGSAVRTENRCYPCGQEANLAFYAFRERKPFCLGSLHILWRCVWKPPLPLNSSLWPFIHLQNASPESQLYYVLSPLSPDTPVECRKNKAARSDVPFLSQKGFCCFPEPNGMSGPATHIYLLCVCLYVYIFHKHLLPSKEEKYINE